MKNHKKKKKKPKKGETLGKLVAKGFPFVPNILSDSYFLVVKLAFHYRCTGSECFSRSALICMSNPHCCTNIILQSIYICLLYNKKLRSSLLEVMHLLA